MTSALLTARPFGPQGDARPVAEPVRAETAHAGHLTGLEHEPGHTRKLPRVSRGSETRPTGRAHVLVRSRDAPLGTASENAGRVPG